MIVPARNAARSLSACLEAILAEAGDAVEIIVVDDASTDETAKIASSYPVRLVHLKQRGGVAAARNAGADAARGRVLFFLDSDVVLAPGGLERGRAAIAQPGVDAVIGSYDDDPAVRSAVSLFKNLAHHHFHQRAGPEASTFWGACGVIRRESFWSVGGFDARRFRSPSVEDIDLGYRLRERGAQIRLDRGLLVKHLKRWTLLSLISTDVLNRAIPWARLSMERGALPAELNLDPSQRVAAGLAVAFAACIALAPFWWPALAACAPVVLAALYVNRDLFRLFLRCGGGRFAVLGFLLQQLYYLYSLAGLLLGVGIHFVCRAWPSVAHRV